MDALTDKPSSREQMPLADVYAPDQRFAAVLKSIDDGFITLDREWVYTALNDYACQSMGRPREEVLGRCIWHLYPDAVGTFFEAELRRAVLEQQTVQFEYFYASRNRWYENRVYPGSEGVSILFTEITHRKHAEEALIASEKRLAGDLGLMKTLQEVSTRLVHDGDANPPLLEIIDAAIDITDADGGSIQMLDRDAGLLRMTASRGVEPPFLNFFATVGRGHDSSCSRAMECGARVVIEDVSSVFAGTPALEVLLAAGVHAVQSTPLVSRSGELLGMLNTYYSTPRVPGQRDLHLLDVLARQAADWIERTHAQENLRQAKRALEEADQHKNEFLAVLAHELRNPLASILAGSRLLRRLEPGARESQQTRDMIEQEVARLTRLVDDLLDVSRVATGRFVLRREPLDLQGIAPASTARAGSGAHRILIVDDNESFATAMTGLLNAMGHDARAIHDGGAALEMVRAMRPLVVVLDINLPGRRGYDIAREIRDDPLTAHTLLIAVTGFAQERDKLQAQRAGFDYHLTKPVDERELERVIDTALAGTPV